MVNTEKGKETLKVVFASSTDANEALKMDAMTVGDWGAFAAAAHSCFDAAGCTALALCAAVWGSFSCWQSPLPAALAHVSVPAVNASQLVDKPIRIQSAPAYTLATQPLAALGMAGIAGGTGMPSTAAMALALASTNPAMPNMPNWGGGMTGTDANSVALYQLRQLQQLQVGHGLHV